jgi:hypothetical protein
VIVQFIIGTIVMTVAFWKVLVRGEAMANKLVGVFVLLTTAMMVDIVILAYWWRSYGWWEPLDNQHRLGYNFAGDALALLAVIAKHVSYVGFGLALNSVLCIALDVSGARLHHNYTRLSMRVVILLVYAACLFAAVGSGASIAVRYIDASSVESLAAIQHFYLNVVPTRVLFPLFGAVVLSLYLYLAGPQED